MTAPWPGYLVKVEPENAVRRINLANAIQRCESIEKVEAILLYAATTRIELDKAVRKLALDDEDLKPLWDEIPTLE